MKLHWKMLLLCALALPALSACGMEVEPTIEPPEAVAPVEERTTGQDQNLATSSSSFFYSASNTSSATTNTVNYNVHLSAGQSIQLGTCGVAGSSGSGDTYLRLYNPSGVQVAVNDDACGVLSNLSYQIPLNASGVYQIRAGCYSSGSCSGTVAYTVNSPISTSGLKLWLRADSGMGFTTDGRVSDWKDQSANGLNAYMTPGSRQPYFLASAVNGKPVVQFQGAQSLAFTNLLRLSNMTLFIVAKNNKASEAFHMILGPGNSSPNNQLRFENGSQVLFVGTGNNMPVVVPTIGNNRVYHALSARYDGSTFTAYRDGGFVSNSSFTTTGPWDLLQIGAWYSQYFLEGDLAEIIAYDRALTETERSEVNGYLRSKYGLP
jgi:hypothetical protein